jgi:hypothetical protein
MLRLMEVDIYIRAFFALLLLCLLIGMGRALWLGRWKIAGEVYRRGEQPLRYWGEMAATGLLLPPAVLVLATAGPARPLLVIPFVLVAILIRWFLSRGDWRGGQAPSQRRGERITFALALGTIAFALGAFVLVMTGVM